MIIKKTLTYVGYTILTIVVFLLLYVAAAFLLPKICVDREDESKEEVQIFIRTNGVHTDIIMPVTNELKDWTTDFPAMNTKSKDSNFDFIAIGWGDKGFYLETPSWDDLKISTALKACIGASGSAIHATYCKNLKLSPTCKSIMLSQDQYNRLVEYVDKSLVRNDVNTTIHIETNGLYGINDAFYEAKGRYSIFFSCNSWSNNALKACGQKACLWTVLQNGIFKNYD